ncbi:MAG: TetR/AcrR family transcriptional regulator [Gammaproteobacteria bacterium]|nr:TetR/AcrR family transcriptional regulator [Gammaproteobacteria bacterium]
MADGIKQPRATRETLEDQLVTVFKKRGYEGATLTQLAESTGLGKASLYHHFPGGKAEMAAVLLRRAVARLQKAAFSRLRKSAPAALRLRQFVDGFSTYTQHGESHCLIVILAQGSAGEVHGESIAQQFRDWTAALSAVFEETGQKPRRAGRSAADLLARLYGNLVTTQLRHDPKAFRRGIKRIKKTLPG